MVYGERGKLQFIIGHFDRGGGKKKMKGSFGLKGVSHAAGLVPKMARRIRMEK